MKIIAIAISAAFGLILSGVANAAPQDHFGGAYQPAAAEVAAHFNCDEIDDDQFTDFWTCKTKINVGQGFGLVDLRVMVRHRSPPFSGGVVKYTFETPRNRLIRDTSFRGIIGLAQFFGADVSKELNSQENYKSYLRGQDVFEVQGLLFEVSETSSSFKLTVQDADGEHTHVGTLAKTEPDTERCWQTDGLPGWHITWSHRHATIEPAFKPLSPDYKMIAGSFSIGPDTVTPSFREAFGRVRDGQYITIFVDSVPIYQSRWVEKKLPTCCTLYVETPMPKQLLFSMADGAEAIILLSRDAAGERVIAASRIDLPNIGKAADRAIGGRFERATAERLAQCTR